MAFWKSLSQRILARATWVALLLSLAGAAASYLVATRIFEAVPHVEDEMAYVWQAKVLAHGQLTVPTPPDPASLAVPFVVDANGVRSAKYPPGWPMLLAFGILLGARTWVNPLLSGLAVWLTFRLGQRLFGGGTGLLAALLTVFSPFFLINSGSLDSHPWALVLSLAFVLAWLELFPVQEQPADGARHIPGWITVPLAGLGLGLLVLTRPLTAVGVGLPFFGWGLALLWRGSTRVRVRVLAVGGLALAVGGLLFAWQAAVTGSPFKDPYTLWWSFDRLGFGPGVSDYPGGYSPAEAVSNAWIMLRAAARDLFGWGSFSWLLLPFGVWAAWKNRPAGRVALVFPSLVFVYLFYWAYVTRYGPRYYYEGLFCLTLLSAAGLVRLVRWLGKRPVAWAWQGLVTLGLLGLIGYNLADYLPARLTSIYGLYGIHPAQMAPFLTSAARQETPALVFVHEQKSWTDYAGLLELENPWLSSPFIFAVSSDPAGDARLAAAFPGRRILYYSPGQPTRLSNHPNRSN